MAVQVQAQPVRRGCLNAFFASAWRSANALFTTRHLFLGGEGDEVMDRIYAVRAWLGLAVVTAVGVRYHGEQALRDQVDASVNVLYSTVLTIAVVLGIGLLLAIAWTSPRKWFATAKQLVWPIYALGAFFAVCYAFVFITRVSGAANRWHHVQGFARVGGGLGYFVAVLWVFVFVPRALYLLAGGWCRAGDVHPLLPPLVGSATTWVIAAKSLMHGVGADGTPQKIALAVTLGGPISVTLLSILEMGRLRYLHRQAWPFRDGPLPTVHAERRESTHT